MFKQVSLNSLWLLSGRIATLGLNVIFVALVARRLEVNAFGQYALIASIVYLGNFFTTYGTDVMLIREIAREQVVPNTVFTSLWLQLLLSCIWILIVGTVAVFFMRDDSLLKTLNVMNVSLIPLAFQSIYNAILRAFERMEIYALLNLFNIALQTIVAYLIIHTANDLLMLGILILICQMLVACAGYFLCKTILPDLDFIRRASVKQIGLSFLAGWQLALLAPMAALFQRLNLFILSMVLGTTTAGILSAASRLVEGIKIGHFSISNSLMPAMARPVSAESEPTFRFSFVFLLFWSLMFAICLMFFAGPIVELIYGNSYGESVGVLRVIGWVLIPYTFSVYYSLHLTMKGFEASVLMANLIVLPCAAVLCFILIRGFGLLGAGWSMLLNEIIFALILLFFYTSHRYRSV